MQNGLTDEQVEAGFLSSPEYIADHGSTWTGWVVGMYHDLLGRAPTPRAKLVGSIICKTAAVPRSWPWVLRPARSVKGCAVGMDYQVYLGRSLDPAGQASWVSYFVNGARNEDVVAGFLGSQEYYVNLEKGQSNRTFWIQSMFQDVLHRSATADEVANLLRAMN